MPVSCPHCAQPFEPERSGIQFCPRCGGQLEVPASAVSASPPPSVTPGGAPNRPGTASEIDASGAAGTTGGTPGWRGPSNLPPPAPGAPPSPDAPVVPWERRTALGFFPALFATVKESLFSPQPFWLSVRADGPMSDALWYGWLVAAVAVVLRVPFAFADRNAMAGVLEQLRNGGTSGLPPETQEMMAKWVEMLGMGGVGMNFAGAVMAPLSLVIAAAVLHLCGLITGAASKGFGATFRIVCYASTPTLFAVHSCTGALAGIYQLVLVVMGIRIVHGTTAGKSVATVLLPALVLCACCCAGVALAGFAAAASGAAGAK